MDSGHPSEVQFVGGQTTFHILPNETFFAQGIGGDHLNAPRLRLAARIGHIHVKTGVGILSIDAREGALQIRALVCVELHPELMVGERWGGYAQQSWNCNQKAGTPEWHRNCKSSVHNNRRLWHGSGFDPALARSETALA